MEDFVPYELAVKLKEKGFKYNKMNLLDRICMENQINHPTISQVLEWLIKEKDIYITIFIDDDSDTPVTYEIYKNTECICTHQGEYFTLKDWDKCELRAIEYTLDNLI